MARDDKKEDEELEKEQAEKKEAEVQIVTNDQLINFKLDQILEKLESLENPKQ